MEDGEGSSGSSNFCTGSGMVMFMDGFTWSVGAKKQPECLALFFTSWKLDTETKFVWACVGVACLAVSVEAMSAFRRLRVTAKETLLRRIEMITVYGSQLVVGYVLMLCAMTYSVEIFASAILGILFGHFFLRRIGTRGSRLACLSSKDHGGGLQTCCGTTDGASFSTGAAAEDYRLLIDDEDVVLPHSLGLSIPAMICESCVHTVQDCLLGCEGVCAVRVDLANKRAFVFGTSYSVANLFTALDRSGYAPASSASSTSSDRRSSGSRASQDENDGHCRRGDANGSSTAPASDGLC